MISEAVVRCFMAEATHSKIIFRTQDAKSSEMRKFHECAIFEGMADEENQESAEAIGRRIVLLREALGHTQASFARKLTISYQRLSMWERGKQKLPRDGAFMIRSKTGATQEWLYHNNEGSLPRDLAQAIDDYRQGRKSA